MMIPGFTADSSLYKGTVQYRSGIAYGRATAKQGVVPQLERLPEPPPIYASSSCNGNFCCASVCWYDICSVSCEFF
jgi:hypothetical protein